MRITLLGEPGAGKTTLGHGLEKAAVGTYISGSALIDQYVSEERQGWEAIRDNKSAGKRADPKFTHFLLAERLSVVADSGAVILDGFPKRSEELEMTEECLGAPIDLALLLECESAESVRRVRGRLRCDRCGAVTNECFSPGPTHAQCGGSYLSRLDDHPDAQSVRQHEDFTEPLVELFEADGRVRSIPQLLPPEALHQAIALIQKFP